MSGPHVLTDGRGSGEGPIASLRTRIKVGVAGWGNPPGSQKHRPAGESHLAHYADQFTCVEINSSFYREHRTSTYLAWRRETPRSFQFSVKMPRTITHDAALGGVRQETKRFFDTIEPLGGKLGAVLIQLPPSLVFERRRVNTFLQQLPDLGKGFCACEPRHASWFTPAADELLRKFGVSRVAADPARTPGAERPGGNTEHAYFRWHGSPRMYYSSYSDEQLLALAAQLTAERRRAPWCIFDNTARYAAWNDARRLVALICR